MTAEESVAADPVFRVGALPAQASDDSARAVEALFLECQQRIGRYLVQFVGDRELAEDLLQDSFHDALRSGAQLSGVDNPEAWLFGIARHRALRAVRRRSRFRGALRRLGAAPAQSPGDEELVTVQELLARTLSPEDRALVLLRYLHGFDAVELAAMTGATPEAVRQRLSRACARLRTAVEGEET